MRHKLFSVTFRVFFSRLVNYLHLIELSVKCRSPFLVAALTFLIATRINRGQGRNIICVGRPIFDEDIASMAESSGKLSYLVIPKSIFIKVFTHFLPRLVKSHKNYHSISGYEDQRVAYRIFMSKFLGYFNKFSKIDAIFSANYNYSWQQELSAAAQSIGIPVAILFKEGISPLYKNGIGIEQSYDLLVSRFTNNYFIGDKLLVYNQRVYDGFRRISIKGIKPTVVSTVGIPRFDRYKSVSSSGENIVFFSFNFEDKARHLGLSSELIQQFKIKTREFHSTVMTYALKNPGENVIIKTKSNPKHLDYVLCLAEDLGCAKLKNLSFTNREDVFDLISGAKAVIGYNSTTLLEALAAMRIIISPDFRDGPIRDFFDCYPSLTHYVTTAEDISRVMSDDSIQNNKDGAERSALLTERIHIPDGQAGARAESAIIQMIQDKQAQINSFAPERLDNVL